MATSPLIQVVHLAALPLRGRAPPVGTTLVTPERAALSPSVAPPRRRGPERDRAPNKKSAPPEPPQTKPVSVRLSANSPTFLISRECLLVSGGTNREKEKYTAGATGGGRGALGLAPWVAWRLKTPIRRPSPPLKETASLERHDSTLPRRAHALSA